jgi:hypothetical protein
MRDCDILSYTSALLFSTGCKVLSLSWKIENSRCSLSRFRDDPESVKFVYEESKILHFYFRDITTTTIMVS